MIMMLSMSMIVPAAMVVGMAFVVLPVDFYDVVIEHSWIIATCSSVFTFALVEHISHPLMHHEHFIIVILDMRRNRSERLDNGSCGRVDEEGLFKGETYCLKHIHCRFLVNLLLN